MMRCSNGKYPQYGFPYYCWTIALRSSSQVDVAGEEGHGMGSQFISTKAFNLPGNCPSTHVVANLMSSHENRESGLRFLVFHAYFGSAGVICRTLEYLCDHIGPRGDVAEARSAPPQVLIGQD